MNWEKTIFDNDVLGLEPYKLEITRKGEYISESSRIVKLHHLYKLIKASGKKHDCYYNLPGNILCNFYPSPV